MHQSRVVHHEMHLPAGAGFTFRNVVPSVFLNLINQSYAQLHYFADF